MFAQQPVQTQRSETPQKKAALFVAAESESNEEWAWTERSLERNKAEAVISAEDCPLQWWSKHVGENNKRWVLGSTCHMSVPWESLVFPLWSCCGGEASCLVIWKCDQTCVSKQTAWFNKIEMVWNCVHSKQSKRPICRYCWEINSSSSTKTAWFWFVPSTNKKKNPAFGAGFHVNV